MQRKKVRERTLLTFDVVPEGYPGDTASVDSQREDDHTSSRYERRVQRTTTGDPYIKEVTTIEREFEVAEDVESNSGSSYSTSSYSSYCSACNNHAAPSSSARVSFGPTHTDRSSVPAPASSVNQSLADTSSHDVTVERERTVRTFSTLDGVPLGAPSTQVYRYVDRYEDAGGRLVLRHTEALPGGLLPTADAAEAVSTPLRGVGPASDYSALPDGHYEIPVSTVGSATAAAYYSAVQPQQPVFVSLPAVQPQQPASVSMPAALSVPVPQYQTASHPFSQQQYQYSQQTFQQQQDQQYQLYQPQEPHQQQPQQQEPLYQQYQQDQLQQYPAPPQQHPSQTRDVALETTNAMLADMTVRRHRTETHQTVVDGVPQPPVVSTSEHAAHYHADPSGHFVLDDGDPYGTDAAYQHTLSRATSTRSERPASYW